MTRVTIKDVAKAAGVSVGTASNSLHGNKVTSAATAAKVCAIAESLGYIPDPTISIAMSSIRRQQRAPRGDTIAYINGFPQKNEWRKWSILQDYWVGARERAKTLGYHLEEYWIGDPAISESRHSQILYSRGIRGLILAPHPQVDARLRFKWNHFASIAISRSILEPMTHSVLDDHYAFVRVAILNLMRLGYRRIGFVSSLWSIERTNRIAVGAYLAFQADLPKKNRLPICAQDIERDADFDGPGLLKWFEKYRPDAIIGSQPSIQKFLEEQGYRCPEEFGYVAIDLDSNDQLHAGILHRSRQVGHIAVTQLDSMIRNREFGIPKDPQHTIVEGTWHEGKSVRSQN